MNKIEVLDCTLRDGSYLINFQFNTNDTYHISKLLEKAGLKYIEVGHGLGLDAGKNKGSSLENDIDYIKAAKQAVTTSKIGVFYIPGIGNMESIKNAHEAGLDFIRIGVNVEDFANAKETIEYAKGLGLEVWLNLMKTYTVDFKEWTNICHAVKDYKCDHFAVVDSAGGMLPQDVKKYCQIAKEITPFGIGFHGHNNMQLAVANCLAAIDGGATIVDGTLFGMGRSGGNASTEILAAILQREGLPVAKYDVEALIEIANEMIAPMARRNLGDGAIELAAGLNYFHSSFFKTVQTVCEKSNSSIFRTILHLPVESRKNVTKEMVEKSVTSSTTSLASTVPSVLHKSNTLYIKNLEELGKYLKEIVGKTNRKVSMSLCQSASLDEGYRISSIFALEESLVGHIEFSQMANLEIVIKGLDGLVDTWILEKNLKLKTGDLLKTTPFFYDEEEIERSVLVNELINSNRNVFILKKNGNKIISKKDPAFSINQETSNSGNLFVAGNGISEITQEFTDILLLNDHLILTHKCRINESCWKVLNEKKVLVYRLNYTLSLAYEIEKIIKYKELVQEVRGCAQKNGLDLVSGGVVNRQGNVIVDSIHNPSMVLGLTDGDGGVRKINEEENYIKAIKENVFAELR